MLGKKILNLIMIANQEDQKQLVWILVFQEHFVLMAFQNTLIDWLFVLLVLVVLNLTVFITSMFLSMNWNLQWPSMERCQYYTPTRKIKNILLYNYYIFTMQLLLVGQKIVLECSGIMLQKLGWI